MKKIAILLSSYNGEKYISGQIESIINQKSSCEISIIVRDDGSKDSTVSILENYCKLNKIELIKGDNYGPSKSFLWLLKEYRDYDYYSFSDQDDIWDINKIEKGIDVIKEIEKPTLYCSNSKLVDEDLNSYGRNTHRYNPTFNLESVLALLSCAQGCTIVINKALAKIVQNNRLPENIVMHDSLVTCLCAAVNGKIIYDHNPTMKYRIYGENTLGLSTKKQIGIVNICRERLKEIFTKRKVSMSDQANEIINIYGNYINEDNMKICKLVANSSNSLLCRLKLVFSNKVRCDTLNMTITKKLKILFNNN